MVLLCGRVACRRNRVFKNLKSKIPSSPEGGIFDTIDLMLSWNRRRQLAYLLGVIIFIVTVTGFGYWYTKPLPTCSDGRQNQEEIGVDCGGPCVKVCRDQVIPVQTLWVRPFSIVSGTYSVMGLFENQNRTLGVDRLFYTIRLTNDLGATVATRKGEVFVNPQEKFVIFEPNINTDNQAALRAFIDFTSDTGWDKPEIAKPVLSVTRKEFNFADETPKLHALVTNESNYDLENIVVPVVVSDGQQNAFTGSATLIEELGRGQTKDVYFTWPQALIKTPEYVDFYPRANTFRIKRQ
jgi:hypothetical protein